MAKEAKPRAGKKDTGTKAAKAKKDPNAPKRPLSAYMYYSQSARSTVKEENPEASFGELGKILGAKWKEMDEDEKKPFTKQAADDKERYEAEKKDYVPPEGDDDDKPASKPKAKPKAKKAKAASEEDEDSPAGKDDDEDEDDE